MGRMIRIADRLALARDVLPRAAIGAELGVCAGDFADVLYSETRPARLYLVDRWEFPAMGYTDPAVAYAECRDKFTARVAAKMVRCDTVEWLAEQKPSSLDWVYLDSNHFRPHVTRELCQALRVVKAAGWICGHDYGPFTPGVVEAVDEFCQLHGQRIAFLTDEPEAPPRIRSPWMPSVAACNSFAIQVEK